MADIEILLTIPEAKVPKASEGFLYLHPVPLNGMGEPICTPLQWFKEHLRRYTRDVIARGLQKKAQDESEYSPDDEVIV